MIAKKAIFISSINVILILSSLIPCRAQDDKVKLASSLVTLSVVATDQAGRLFAGLKKEDFEVYEDGVKQDIAFFSDDDAPLSLGIIFDISGSMKEKMPKAQKALRKLLKNVHPDDDLFLIAFSNRAQLVVDFTIDPTLIEDRLAMTSPSGNTALYDAVYLGIEKVLEGRHKKKSLIILSDGQDNTSRYTYTDIRNRIREEDIQIYCIGIIDPNRGSELDVVGRSILEDLTRMTGGRSFFPEIFLTGIKSNNPILEEILYRISLELRFQYSIGYYISDIGDGKCHKIKIKITKPKDQKNLPRLNLNYRNQYCNPSLPY